ncbi:vomeronasal type-1 receptor 4-like [Dama dama]
MDMIISTQIVIGILGNFSLLCSYIVLHFMGYSLRSTDLILKHLIVANSLVLCKGVPQTMAVFGWKHIHNDFGCKLLFFLHRVGRGVSISSICLLSVFQAIIISPWDSRWAALKVTAPKEALSAALLLFPDVLCLGLMLWASSSMVLILYRHKQQKVQYIHKASVSPRSSTESRATQSILVLASTFMCFHTLSCIFNPLPAHEP